jgi:predicted metal-binding membrane protein
MNEMHMGMSATTWVPMMAAMMLPSTFPVLWPRRSEGPLAAARFAGGYVAVWAAVAFALYELGRPHGMFATAAVLIAVLLYELGPLNRYCLSLCRSGQVRSGFAYGACCVGSSIGLMAVLAVLGPMEMTWMVVIAALVLAQKLLPLPHLLTQGELA